MIKVQIESTAMGKASKEIIGVFYSETIHDYTWKGKGYMSSRISEHPVKSRRRDSSSLYQRTQTEEESSSTIGRCTDVDGKTKYPAPTRYTACRGHESRTQHGVSTVWKDDGGVKGNMKRYLIVISYCETGASGLQQLRQHEDWKLCNALMKIKKKPGGQPKQINSLAIKRNIWNVEEESFMMIRQQLLQEMDADYWKLCWIPSACIYG